MLLGIKACTRHDNTQPKYKYVQDDHEVGTSLLRLNNNNYQDFKKSFHLGQERIKLAISLDVLKVTMNTINREAHYVYRV